ncbi:MAG: hypothetical protein HWD59_10390 [Coxiellaceae bacterium]|nr:MAG: hypothetical protein HWD59_10390 [Coxiellaceae bacterium]
MILSRTKTDNWDVAISEKMALSVLSYDFISISGQNVQSTSGKLNIGFQMRMIASFEMLQKLLNNKVISDSNCLVFIDKFLAFPSWSKYRDSKDRPRGVGCEILMNLSNMPTALEKMDRSRLVKALAIAIQAEHARVITFLLSV